MNISHTPAPWELQACQLNHGETSFIVGGDGFVICELEFAAWDRRYHFPQDKKNVSLMLAAPELLAALRSIVTSEFNIDNDDNRTKHRLEIRDQFWKLIAKAEGTS